MKKVLQIDAEFGNILPERYHFLLLLEEGRFFTVCTPEDTRASEGLQKDKNLLF